MEPNPDSIPMGPVRVLRGANLVLPDRVVTGDLLLRDHWIERLAPAGQGRGQEIWNLEGFRIAPGFIDLHTHGGWGVDFAVDGVDRICEAAASYGRIGVTRLLITLVPRPWNELLEQLHVAAQACEREPSYIGIHLEGPFLCRDRRGALPEAGIIDYTPERWAALHEAARGQLRIMTFAPEAIPITDLSRIRGQGCILSIGHTSADHLLTRAAIRAGAWRATHLCNAMPGIHHRNPGPIIPLLMDERVRVEVIADGEHLDDEMLRFIIRSKGDEAVVAVSDSMPLTGMGPASCEFAGTEVVSDGCRVTHPDGTLAGSVTPLSTSLLRLERELGLKLPQISRLGSVAPAADLGLPRIGRIATGHRADLVIQESSGLIVTALRDGRRIDSDPNDDTTPFLPEGFERIV